MLKRTKTIERYTLGEVVYKSKEDNGKNPSENCDCKYKRVIRLNESDKNILYLDTGLVIYIIGSLRLYCKFILGDLIVMREILEKDREGNILSFFAIPDERE